MSQDFFKTNHEKIASCGNKFDIIAHRVSFYSVQRVVLTFVLDITLALHGCKHLSASVAMQALDWTKLRLPPPLALFTS